MEYVGTSRGDIWMRHSFFDPGDWVNVWNSYPPGEANYDTIKNNSALLYYV